MSTFFDISIDHINLFSIMIGISIVSLSSFYSGRIRWTRVSFIYLATLAFYFGYIKDPSPAAKYSQSSPTATREINSEVFSTVDTASAYSGKITKRYNQ